MMNRHSISKELFPGFAADLYYMGKLYRILSAEEGVITVDIQEVNCLISAEDAVKVPIDITQTLHVLQAAIIDAARLGKRVATFDSTELGLPAVDKLIAEVKAKGYSCCRNKYNSCHLDIRW